MRNFYEALAVVTADALIEVYSKLGNPLKRASLSVASILTLGLLAVTANATIFTVTNTNDSGTGSLRQAVLDANANAGPDTIFFSPVTFGQTPQFITLQSELSVTQDLEFNGGTAKQVWINGATITRILNITNANVAINNMGLLGGRALANTDGGAIVVNGGATTLFNVTFSNNSSTNNGAAVHIQSGTLNAVNTTFYANNATQSGGGISINAAGANAIIANSSFVGNTAGNAGGAISIPTGGNISIQNCVFGNNNGTSPDIAGTVTSLGYNLISNTNGTTITGNTTGNQLNVNPQFSFFGDFGGKTWTVTLAANSPAIDAGDPSQTAFIDQRGSRRNTDGNYDGVAGVDIGAFERQKSAFDVEGDGTADLAVTRVTSGNFVWYGGYFLLDSRPESLSPTPNRLSVQTFGLSTDVLAPADYDGDGKLDVAVFRPETGVWYMNRSTAGFAAFQWGLAGDVPVPADYDGDGKADIAVYRAGDWYIYRSTNGYTGTITLGTSTTRPVPADYDGDLKADVAVWGTNGLWTVNKTTGGQISEFFGLIGDIPLPADFDGNGNDNIAVYRPTDGTWYIKRPAGGYDAVPFGQSTDKPIPADYDGDGKVDIAIWRPNTQGGADWWIKQSRDGLTIARFGFLNDFPVANTRLNQ